AREATAPPVLGRWGAAAAAMWLSLTSWSALRLRRWLSVRLHGVDRFRLEEGRGRRRRGRRQAPALLRRSGCGRARSAACFQLPQLRVDHVYRAHPPLARVARNRWPHFVT